MATAHFDASVSLTAATQKACGQIASDFSLAVVSALAEKYGFDAADAIRELGLDTISVKRTSKAKKAKAEKPAKVERDVPKVLLPWTGRDFGGDFCHGLRLNHGLHSQCTMAKCEGGIYCSTCQRQADKNASGKPTYGSIEDRASAGILEYREPKGNKLTIPYANVMEKLGITREAAEAEAARFGLEIPEEHFVKREAKRGRPATKPVADSDGADAKPKKRGRPKKEKKVIESQVGDDLIASLVAQSKADSSADSASDSESAAEKPKKVKKVKAEKPKKVKVELTEEEKAAKKAVAAEKRKEKAAAKKAEKAAAKKEAELAAMKAKMLAMQAEVDAAAKALTSKPETSDNVESDPIGVSATATNIKAAPSPEVELQHEEVEISPPVSIGKADSGDDFGASTEDEEDDEEVQVTKFEHKGKTYLKSSDNMLYDPSNSECVGCWNPQTEEIEEVADFGSDDEDDEE